jgi:hypothetical protein
MLATLQIGNDTVTFPHRPGTLGTYGELLDLEPVKRHLTGGLKNYAIFPKVTPLEGRMAASEVTLGYHKGSVAHNLSDAEIEERIPESTVPSFGHPRSSILCDMFANKLYLVEPERGIVGKADAAFDDTVLFTGKTKIHEFEDVDEAAADGEGGGAPGDLLLFCKTMTGKTFAVNMSPTCTVDDLKTRIFEKGGGTPCQQRLIWKGIQLEDGLELGEMGIPSKSTISIVHRLRGGMLHATSAREDFERLGGTFQDTTVRVIVPGYPEGMQVVVQGRDTADTILAKVRGMISGDGEPAKKKTRV